MMQARWYQDEAVDATFEYFDAMQGFEEDGITPKRANPLICLPTGTGKSLVIALIIMRAMAAFPRTRPIMGTHVKELVEQNADKLIKFWEQAPIGLYSAGMKRKEFEQPIIYGNIQSMAKKLNAEGKTIFGFRDFLIIDEAHLVSPNNDTTYIEFILNLLALNPWLKVIGLSATPYRMGLGHLTEGQIFTDVVYNLCTIEGFGRLLAEGYLSPIFPRPTDTTFDLSGVGMSKGEFQQGALEAAVDKSDVTYGAVQEMIRYGWNRRAWLVFAAGIEHSEHVAEALRINGVAAQAVHSKMPRDEVDRRISAFKRGELRCIVNKDMLTTGFDFPPIDLVGMMRPTLSTGLWVQMLGRATRPWLEGGWIEYAPGQSVYVPGGKKDAVVLDFAGNTPRLGPINDPLVPKPRKKGDKPQDAPIKICPERSGGCGTYVHSSTKVCAACGYEFPAGEQGPGIVAEAGTAELMKTALPETEWFFVDRVILAKHFSKRSGKWSIKAAHYCGLQTFFAYITVEENAASFAKKKGRDWVRERTGFEPPSWSDDDVIANAHLLRVPQRVEVWTNKQPQPDIIRYDFGN